MTYHEYQRSRVMADQDEPFYALIMAAMRRADTVNQVKLQAAWPVVWEELEARYWAPGGLLDTDPEARQNPPEKMSEDEYHNDMSRWLRSEDVEPPPDLE